MAAFIDDNCKWSGDGRYIKSIASCPRKTIRCQAELRTDHREKLPYDQERTFKNRYVKLNLKHPAVMVLERQACMALFRRLVDFSSKTAWNDRLGKTSVLRHAIVLLENFPPLFKLISNRNPSGHSGSVLFPRHGLHTKRLYLCMTHVQRPNFTHKNTSPEPVLDAWE